MYSDTTNVEPKTLDYTSNNWSYRHSDKRFQEKFGSRTRKTFTELTAKDLKHHT